MIIKYLDKAARYKELKVLKEAYANSDSFALWKMVDVRMYFAVVVIIYIFLSHDYERTALAAEQELLQVGFYQNSCPHAELIVADEVRKSFVQDIGIAAGIIRLSFHDCFVRVSYLILFFFF